MMQEIITNAATGEVTIRDFTPEEIAARTPDPDAVLAAWRETAHCSRMQGILALGEARWAVVLEYRATATWAEQVVIDDAGDWRRNSENIAFFGWLVNLTDLEIDALFAAAAAITA
jgi:hypothetical protein